MDNLGELLSPIIRPVLKKIENYRLAYSGLVEQE